jgi:hypothetical protein
MSGYNVWIEDVGRDGTGPWKVFVNGHGIAMWPSKGAQDDPEAYAAEVGRCLHNALQAKAQD